MAVGPRFWLKLSAQLTNEKAATFKNMVRKVVSKGALA
jgi:hypothetical protein